MQAYRPSFAQRHPLVLPVAALATGMLAYGALPLAVWALAATIGCLGILATSRKEGILPALRLLTLVLAFAGVGGVAEHSVRLHPVPTLGGLLQTPHQETLLGTAGLGEKIPGGKYALRFHVEAVVRGRLWQPVEAVVNLRLPAGHYPEPGTRLAVTGFYVPNHPDEGDPLWQGYPESLARQDVAGSLFATTPRSHWHLLKPPPAWDIRVYAQRAALRLNALLDIGLGATPEAAVAKALLLGTRETLTDDLKRSYASAGAIHLLVVSGGHLAILWGLLFWLLKRLPPRWQGNGRWIGRVCLILCLWAFAFLTGLGPSIVRAALMLTLVQVGIALGRPGSGLNALAAACLLMLLWDPLTVYAVGFQLSVACVAGILVLTRPIEAWWQPQHRVSRTLWKAFAVTLAAQAGALPVSLLHFGQMPVWFWLANPPAVLLSEVLVWAMLPLLVLLALSSAFSWLVWVWKPLAWGVAGLLHLLNAWMSIISGLPLAVQEGWFFPVGQVLVLVGGLIWLATVPRGIGLRHGRYAAVLAAVWCFLVCKDLTEIDGQRRIALCREEAGFGIVRQQGLRMQGPQRASVRQLANRWRVPQVETDSQPIQASAIRVGSTLLVPSKGSMSSSLRRRARLAGWQVVDLSRQSFYVLPNTVLLQ